MLAGMERELSFHPAARLRMLNAHSDSELQVRQIQQLLQEGIDLLIVSPNMAAPLAPAVEAAWARHVPVVLLDRRTTAPHYTAYVGASNEEIGRTAAQYAARLLHQQGRVVEILGTRGSSATAGRHQGFAQGLQAYPGLRMVGQVAGDWREATLKPALTDLLRAHPEVKLIFAHNDGMARGAYEVCQALGCSRRVRIIGVDGLPGPGEGLDLITRGKITASLLYPPGGEDAIRVALKILRQQPFRRENKLGTLIIDSTNVETMQQQTEKVLWQQQEIEQQQSLLEQLRATYASQQVALGALALSLLAALGLGTLAWRAARRNRLINQQNERINQQLVSQNQEISSQRNQLAELAERARTDTEAKLRFFTNFTHELRTPLTLILGPLEELRGGSASLAGAQREQLGLMRRNTQRLLQLVNQLLDFRKIEVGKTAVHARQTDLVSFVREIAEVFAPALRGRGVQLQVIARELALPTWFDGNILDKVFFNLLSNALKFTPDQGLITVSLASTDDGRGRRVSIADTGQGISAHDQAHIFEWFYQGDQGGGARGSGLGLALARGLVRLHQGELTFSSQAGQGSTFVVSLPSELPAALRSPALAQPAALGFDEPEPLPAEVPEAPVDTTGEPLLLVLEDNPEVQQFIVRKLRADYQVRSAPDGLSGLQLAQELIPDLIVCDVMMPGLSGLEVLARLRADWRTSHIPLVLLTARDTPEQQLDGVLAGADLYLTKPFNPAFLLESVRTLLRNQTLRREQFRRAMAVDGVSPVASADQKFLAEFTSIIEADLTRADLSVEEIARRLGVSRMQLYRKVKAVLGVGVSDFIQATRLTKARELLLSSSLTIAQVGYELGFSSPSYFSTSFRARYQLTPTEFRARHAAATN
jgi:signal transduction histidine kinase/DNA-binding response OmpR family regulator